MTPDEAGQFLLNNAGKVQDMHVAVLWWLNGEGHISLGVDGKYTHLALGDAASSLFRGIIDKLEDHAPKNLEDKLASTREQIDRILRVKP